MNSDEILAINNERLGNWGHQLMENHATPILCIGVGHDHMAGTVHLCFPDEIEKDFLVRMLKGAIDLLEADEG